jgi:hypothetical protein
MFNKVLSVLSSDIMSNIIMMSKGGTIPSHKTLHNFTNQRCLVQETVIILSEVLSHRSNT